MCEESRCEACWDSGVLLPALLCPLCEGHGRDGMRRWERARSGVDRGRLLVERILRTRHVELTAEECVLVEAALRPRNRRRGSKSGRGPRQHVDEAGHPRPFAATVPALTCVERAPVCMGVAREP